MRKTATVVPPAFQMMSQRGLWMLIFLCFGTLVEAQGWQYTFGGNKEDQGAIVRETIDHGFIALGFSESFEGVNNSDIDIYIVRTDVDGTPI